jgi:hypothetical protein
VAPTSSHAFPQLTIHRDAAGPRVIGRTPNVPVEWEDDALNAIARFGERRGTDEEKSGVFATPKQASGLIFVVAFQLRIEGSPDAFRVLIVPRRERLAIDPWQLLELFPHHDDKGELVPIAAERLWPTRRDVNTIRTILKEGDSPLLLGSAQALLDGCKIAVNQTDVSPHYVQELWQLLPDQSRMEWSFASYARSTENRFDVVVLPEGRPISPGYLSAEQVRDYPEGRYELALQFAAENGDQRELDRLFARKTSNQILKMVIAMIAFALAAIVIIKLI